MFRAIVNGSLMLKHVIQIKNGIMEHVYVSLKIIVNAKKITIEILAHAFVKMVSISKVLLISNYV